MPSETLINAGGTQTRPSAGEVMAALRVIEASTLFAQSARHRKFLRHLVECWARHDVAQLREISLGVTVFGRASATFDPARDSIVRVEARRLRARLARFYASEGADSSVRIMLEPGSYVPEVEYSNAGAAPRAAGIADVAWVGLVFEPVADPLLRAVTGELRRFLAGTRGISASVGSPGVEAGARAHCIVTVQRATAGDSSMPEDAGIALRIVSRDAGIGPGKLPTRIGLPASLSPEYSADVVGRYLGYSLLGAGLAAGWCPQPATMTPPCLGDEVSRDRFHRAQLAFRQRSIAGYDAALRLYESLLDSGVGGAAIHAGLARCCVALAGMIAMPVREAMPRARRHAVLALAEDADCGDAHCVIAQVATLHDRQWDRALHHYLLGIQRCPRHAPLHQALAFASMYRGDYDLADCAFQTAIMLDPLDLQTRIQRWLVPYYRGCYDEAICGWQDLLAAAPENLLASTLVGAAHLAAGRAQEALSCYRSAGERQPQHPIGNAGMAQAFAMLGDEPSARQQLHELEQKASRGYVSPYLFAMVYCRLGDHDSSYRWLRRSASEPDFNFVCAAVDPTFQALRKEPRWATLCAETGLPLLAMP